ncbi:MAG: hypothetical protein V4760_08495 [Bdellovibrionota bacterium]
MFLAVVSSLSGCAGKIKSEKTVVGEQGTAQGQWRGKAMVRDLRKNGKSGTLDLDLVAKEPSALRIEAASSFGIPIASVAMSGGDIEILLPQEKKFITSPADRGSLSRLIPVRISPDALLAILFDRPLDRDKDWKCDRGTGDANGQWTCKTMDQVVVTREADDGAARKFTLSSPSADMRLSLTEAKAKVQATSGLFDLEAPQGYKVESR